MAKYRIYGIASVSKFLGVIEADSEGDALDKASTDEDINARAIIDLCHYCSRNTDIGDIDEFTADVTSDDETDDEYEE